MDSAPGERCSCPGFHLGVNALSFFKPHRMLRSLVQRSHIDAAQRGAQSCLRAGHRYSLWSGVNKMKSLTP